MKQSARPAVPRARRRSAALGSLLAAAALLVGLVLAPAAVAAPAAPAVPALGSVRLLAVDLDVRGAAPIGLKLSGAGIRFASTTSTTTGTCLTNALGRCDVRWASNGKVSGNETVDLRLPSGTYTVSQVAEPALPGLQPKPGNLATVTICDCWHTILGFKVSERSGRLTVPNTSQYRHTITARVVDQVTGAPVRDARYRLTGPGFPGLLGNPAVLDAGVERSNQKGDLTFTTLVRAHIFRPGAWTLTPVDVPAPYLAVPLSVELTADAPGGGTWAFGAVELSLPATGSATLTLEPAAPVPPDLDLSGARFELIGPGAEPIAALCVTDAAGSCSIEVVPDGGTSDRPGEGTEIALPAGTYTVQQLTAPAGLTPATEIAPLELCVSGTPGECATARVVANASLFRAGTEVTLLADDGPVANTGITLTGEGFAAAARTTAEDGRAEWSGWFLPGQWRFDVEGRSEPFVMTMAPPQGDPTLPWRIELTLPPAGQPNGTDGNTGAAPTTPTSTPPTATPPTAEPPAPGQLVPVVPEGAGAPRTAAPSTAPAPGARVVVPEEPAPEPVAPAAESAPATGSTPPSPGTDGGDQVFVAAEGPELTTESSSQLLAAGLVAGVGILFVALVLTGYGVLRSRARRRA